MVAATGKQIGTGRAIGRWVGLCMALLVLDSIVAYAAGAPAAAGHYQFFPCETPVKVSVQGMPEVAGIRLHGALESCGSGQAQQITPADADIEVSERWAEERDRMPRITVTDRNGRFDIELLWTVAATPIRYQALGLAAHTSSGRLEADSAGGPDLRVSIEPISGDPRVGVIGTDFPASRLLDDLERHKGLRFLNASLLADSRVSFNFENMEVRSLIQLLAESAQVRAMRQGPSTYAFQRVANAARIEALRSEWVLLFGAKDRDRRKAMLEEIVALSRPTVPAESPAEVVAELQELARMAIEDKDYVRAEDLIRAQIGQITDFSGTDSSAQLGLALLELGRVLHLRAEREAATDSLLRSVEMLKEHPTAETSPERARGYRELAVIALEFGDLDGAARTMQQAYALLDSPDLSAWDKDLVRKAREESDDTARRIAAAFWKNDDHVRAQPHLEQALALTEALHGDSDAMADGLRSMVILNLLEQHEPKRAATFQAAQVRASESREEPLTGFYFDAIRGLAAYRAEQEDFSEALRLWKRHIALLRESSRLDHAVEAAALRDLALLERLNGDTGQAASAESEARQLSDASGGAPTDETSGTARSLTRRSLAEELSEHYHREVEALTRKGQIASPAMALARWREAESLAAGGDVSFAITQLHLLDRALRSTDTKAPGIANRLPARLQELCATWKAQAVKKTIPQGSCP